MQRLIALTCSALARSIYAAAATSPHTVSVRLYNQGLHNTPKLLRERLQAEIDSIQPNECDAIVMVYGVCGTSTVGLVSRHTPLVIPRAHDCITLYLGSHQRYQEEFDAHPGTYWYSLDYMERNEPGSTVALGAATIETTDKVYQEYVEKFGKETADYLMEVMGEWGKHYDRAVYIEMGLGDGTAYEQMAQEQATKRGWAFERKEGNRRLLNMMIHGEWPENEFLVVPPGHMIEQVINDSILRAVPINTPAD